MEDKQTVHNILTPAQQRWHDHLTAADVAGISLRAYADREGLPVQSLYTWKQKLRKKGLWPTTQRAITLRRAKVLGTPLLPSPAGAPPGYRIHLPNGVMVELSASGLPPLAEVLSLAGALS